MDYVGRMYRDNWNRLAELSGRKTRSKKEDEEYHARITLQNSIPKTDSILLIKNHLKLIFKVNNIYSSNN